MITKVSINKFKVPQEFDEKIKNSGLEFTDAGNGFYLCVFESVEDRNLLLEILEKVYVDTIGDGKAYLTLKNKINIAFYNVNSPRKLYCFSKSEFEEYMEDMGFEDELPHGSAAISIGNFSSEEEHYFNDHFDNVFNVNFDDCSPYWFGEKFEDAFMVAERLYKNGMALTDANALKKSAMFFDRVIIDDDGNFRTVHTFNFAEATRLVNFIDRHVKNGTDFYIHCGAGISRSQAVVRYILDVYTNTKWETRKSNPCITPNEHIVRMLKRAAVMQNII